MGWGGGRPGLERMRLIYKSSSSILAVAASVPATQAFVFKGRRVGGWVRGWVGGCRALARMQTPARVPAEQDFVFRPPWGEGGREGVWVLGIRGQGLGPLRPWMAGPLCPSSLRSWTRFGLALPQHFGLTLDTHGLHCLIASGLHLLTACTASTLSAYTTHWEPPLPRR